ncbi:MAG: HNH endonuclease [Muribaculaceae bacterium]|nr:HNH endonuclease [Muribaculaceae bacterium]
MQNQVKYRIYPSLLDAFQNLLDYELVAEENWNKVSEANHARGEYLDREVGDFKLTPDEMYLRDEAALINTINRIPKEPSEAADKGTVFNEIIDCLHENRRCALSGCSLASNRDYGHIYAEYNGFKFTFGLDFCRRFADMFKGSLTQFRCEAEMDTAYGRVLLYGFIDEWKADRITDIKTTSWYDFGKYARKWQRHLYPWCVIESGLTDGISMFEYAVVELRKNAYPIQGTYFKEEYPYNHQQSTLALRAHVERFIEWLESRREFITNPAIFGGQMPDDYVGQPIDPNLLISSRNNEQRYFDGQHLSERHSA